MSGFYSAESDDANGAVAFGSAEALPRFVVRPGDSQ